MYKDNNTEKHNSPARKIKRKSLIIAIAAIMCSLIAAATVAYVFTSTSSLENTFVPTTVGCDIDEDFDGEVKTDVAVKNTGSTKAYVRAEIVVTWMSEDKTQVYAQLPVEGTDYTISYGDTKAEYWEEAADGYWYYKQPVEPEALTAPCLIKECKLTEAAAPPEGYRLSVEIIASAIQATPENVVKEQWSSGVSNVVDSKLVIKQGG